MLELHREREAHVKGWTAKPVPGKSTAFQPAPCANRPNCKVRHLCSKYCNTLCKMCRRYDYKRILKPP